MAEPSFHLHNGNPKMKKTKKKEEFPPISSFWSSPRPPSSFQTIVCSLNSALLRSSCPFPYFFLLSLEAGSPVRAFLLLCLFPIALVLSLFNRFAAISDDPSLRLFIFISTAGLPISEIQGVSKAVLAKFFLDDLHLQTFKLLTSSSTAATDSSSYTIRKRYVVTSYPRVMVEHFLKEHVGVDEVFGTELQVNSYGFCTGLVKKPVGILMGKKKVEALQNVFHNGDTPDIAFGSGDSDYPFMSWSKEAFIVDPKAARFAKPVPRHQYKKPLVFHDGRLVQRPTPMAALAMFLWLPSGFMLALARFIIVECLPFEIGMPIGAFVGFHLRVKGAPPLPLPSAASGESSASNQGVLFVSSHRSLVDPLVTFGGFRRHVRSLIYSVSPVSEFISPIRLLKLTRDREQDKRLIAEHLERGEDLFITPEGTTGREEYLLRYSSLFAELTDEIVPVGMKLRGGMFHGTSARGYKALDALFIGMNPRPKYEMVILERLGREETMGGGGKSSVEVAGLVQEKVAAALGFTCTQLTRRDKYMALAGTDGSVPTTTPPPPPPPATARKAARYP